MTTLSSGHKPFESSFMAAVFLLTAIPGVIWWLGMGNLGAYFSLYVPQGQLFYIFSKLFGLYAYFLMALQIVVGMQGRRSRFFTFHPAIGALTTIAVITHVALFVAAASARSNHLALDNLIPDFGHGYFKTSVSLGVIALYLLLPVIVAGIWLKRASRQLLWLHRLAFVVAGLGWLHSIRIGTETGQPIITAFYVASLVWVCYSVAIRIISHFRGR